MKCSDASSRQQGLSLVEVMVGMAVGLIATVVIMKSFTASEIFRGNVSGSADMLQTASIASARLGIALEEAGAGMVQGQNVWGCRILGARSGTVLLPRPSTFAEPFASFPTTVRAMPLAILDGGENSDVLAVMAGGSGASNRGKTLTRGPDYPGTPEVTFTNTLGFGSKNAGQTVNDLLLVVPIADTLGDCKIVQLASAFSNGTAVSDLSLGLKLVPAAGLVTSPASYTSTLLNSATYGVVEEALLDFGEPVAYHLGREESAVFSLFSVNARGELTELDMLQRRGTQAIAENVLLLKARYGVDNGADGGIADDNVVDEWIAPTESGWTLATLMNGTKSSAYKAGQIKAVRVGMILRSTLPVGNDAAITSLSLFADLGESRAHTRSLSATEQRYAYQVYDWVIPLRNMKSIERAQ